MAIVISGIVGAGFSVTETDSDTTAGASDIVTEVDSAIAALTTANTDKVIALTGKVGTTPITLDLTAIDTLTGGTDVMSPVKATVPLILTTVKSIVVHNKSVNTILVEASGSDSFLPASEQITVLAGGFVQLGYTTAQAVAGAFNIDISADVDASACEIYILGE